MSSLKLHTETDPDFVYVIYIRTSIEKVWEALSDNKTARDWWAGTRHESSFAVGAPLAFQRDGKTDVRGEILEITPPSKLVYSFHVEGPGPQHEEGASIVTYELAANGDAVKLTVIHSNFPKHSKARVSVSNGWPAILSGLKSVLEGGALFQHPAWDQRRAS